MLILQLLSSWLLELPRWHSLMVLGLYSGYRCQHNKTRLEAWKGIKDLSDIIKIEHKSRKYFIYIRAWPISVHTIRCLLFSRYTIATWTTTAKEIRPHALQDTSIMFSMAWLHSNSRHFKSFRSPGCIKPLVKIPVILLRFFLRYFKPLLNRPNCLIISCIPATLCQSKVLPRFAVPFKVSRVL